MGFRFYRRVKILPGLYLNFSKKGVSTSVGAKGARLTFSKDGTRATVGIPGSGMSYTAYSSKKKKQNPPEIFPQEVQDAKWDLKTYIGCALVSFLILCPIIGVIILSRPWEEEWSDSMNEGMSKAILLREMRKRYPTNGRYEDDFSFRKIEHSRENRSCYLEGLYYRKKNSSVIFKALFIKPVKFDKHSRNWMKVEYIRTE